MIIADPSTQKVISAETTIGQLLRFGVLLSGGLILMGWSLKAFFPSQASIAGAQRLESVLHGEVLAPALAKPESLAQVFHQFCAGNPESMIVVGILLLIALPIVRVALAGCVFALQREYAFVFFCAIVLANLLVGVLSR